MKNNKVYYMSNDGICSGYKIGESKIQEDEIIIEKIKTYGRGAFSNDLSSKNKNEIYNKEQFIDVIKGMLNEKENRLIEVENRHKESMKLLGKEKQELDNYKINTVDTAFNSFKSKTKDINSFKEAEELLKKYRDVYVGYTRKIKALDKKFSQTTEQYRLDTQKSTIVMEYLGKVLNEIIEEEV